MFQIGASLREARIRRGLSQAEVQQAIRIRERYLTALEEERWELLPGEAYAKGFLRTYAEYLGLDGDAYVDEWNSRFAHPDETPSLPEPAAARRRRAGIAVAVATVVTVVTVAAWQLGATRGHPTARTSTHAHVARRPPPPTARTATTPAAAAPVYATFRAARGNCWLLVRNAGPTGPILYERVLVQGNTLRLPVGTSALWVRIGAPWNLDVSVAGRVLAGLPTAPANVLVSRTGIAGA